MRFDLSAANDLVIGRYRQHKLRPAHTDWINLVGPNDRPNCGLVSGRGWAQSTGWRYRGGNLRFSCVVRWKGIIQVCPQCSHS
jgi:hypothetical protein